MTSSDDAGHSDMKIARSQIHFSIDLLRDWLHGSHEVWQKHERMVALLSRDPVFDKSLRPFMTRSERYKRTLKLVKRLLELKELHNWTTEEYATAEALLDEPLPFALHTAAFAPVFFSQGSPYLVETYGDLVANRGILGCYLQTELGHGSNVARLETTATYIPESEEFEIHSPTLSSTKWWIGSLGKTSTHGVVQAQLILPDGRNMGPHLFFVQLRSLENHHVLPNITIGDIGPKAMGGYNAVDNGYAQFNRVRIPREHMLSRFARVTNTGEYVKPPHAKMSYSGMLMLRAKIVMGQGWVIAKAITIAVRYATVRRQGNLDQDGHERQIITYPSVYYRLLPIMSRAYVFILLGHKLGNLFTSLAKKIEAGDTSLIAELHVMSSGLKSLATTMAVQDVETARRALGGHAFSEFAGLGRIYADSLPSTTYEGDNFVLDQQVARAAVKTFQAFSSASSSSRATLLLTPSTSYLRVLLNTESSASSRHLNIDFSSSPALADLLQKRAACLVRQHVAHLDDPDASVEQRVARAVMDAYVSQQVLEMLQEGKEGLGPRELDVLGDLLTLHLLTVIESALADLFSLGLWSTVADDDSSLRLRRTIRDVCLRLMPRAVGVTDAFGFSDWELDSSLGRYDGRVYGSLWDRAQMEPLNGSEVADGYEEFLKPLLKRGQRLSPVRGKL